VSEVIYWQPSIIEGTMARVTRVGRRGAFASREDATLNPLNLAVPHARRKRRR
jgi:hypothetical protein